MSLHLNLRGNGRRRAADKVAELREENVLLHEQRAAADDWFMLLDQHRKELETEVEQLKERLVEEQSARTAIEKDRDAQEGWIQHLEGQLKDAKRRLDIRTWAEAAAAQTQEMAVVTRVLPLHEAPFAATNPGRVRPSWAKDDPAA
ncbi:hypothetical protein [Streptomyces sp. NPDC093060]|uniref:hypothetical protein n=1 Tax=Streptomyces sp. NPDC093060 TaxID=3366019 RepID=UPI00382D4835